MRIYYIRRNTVNKNCLKYEIYHKFQDEDIFDGYAIIKLGAKYRAKQFIFEDLIKYNE